MQTGLGLGLDKQQQFPPFAYAGSIARYDFDVANVTKDGSNNVAQVNDFSGAGKHISQGVQANKPLWVDNGLNTQDILTCDMSGVVLRRVFGTVGPTSYAGFSWTAALIIRCNAAPSAGTHQGTFGMSNNSSGRGGFALGPYDTTRTRRIAATPNVGTVAAATFGTMPLSTWELWVVRITGGGSDDTLVTPTCRVNGVGQSVTGQCYASAVTGNALSLLGGSSAIGSPSFSYAYAEAWNMALSDSAIVQLESALNARFQVY